MLHGNGSVLHKLPLRFIGGSTTSVEPQLRSAFGKAGMLRNRFYQDEQTSSFKLYSIPEGTYAGSAWMLPQMDGAMASSALINGSSQVAGGANLGLQAAASLEGSGELSQALLGLIVSAVANLSGSGGLTASIAGKLEAAANLAGSGNLSGALGALASLASQIYGLGNVAVTPYAPGTLTANIKGYGDLTPEGIRDAVWSAIIESGFTSAQILKLIASATQGAATGLESGNPVFKSLDGTTDRITGTYTSGTRNVTARNVS